MGGISLGFGGFGFTLKHGLKFDEQWWGSFGLLQSFDWEDGSSATTLPFANVTCGDQQSHITVGGGLLARQSPIQPLNSIRMVCSTSPEICKSQIKHG